MLRYLMSGVCRHLSENLSRELARQCLIVSGKSPPHTFFISNWHIWAVSQKAWHTGDSFERLSCAHSMMASGVSRHGRKQSDLISAPHCSLTAGEGVAADAACDDMKITATVAADSRRNRRAKLSGTEAHPAAIRISGSKRQITLKLAACARMLAGDARDPSPRSLEGDGVVTSRFRA
ncbi:hypothetical protein [Bradyrhizobium japonicum]|uniref:hypothetical protein n=1 Tax=Bradyrhizobium japonicum TaxID=375 RepID=UPI001BA711F0|nr:hypothetical protein [Bradyrhizobium japonicum]MBR0959489.1 hypothetical protein [Bradyrhizobium japonicum]